MVVSMPRKGVVRTEPRNMVRVQLKENDVRSYTREEAEELIVKTPGAFIVGERPEDEAPAKGRRSAPNKARQPKAEPPTAPAAPTAPVETKAEPPTGAPPEPPDDPKAD